MYLRFTYKALSCSILWRMIKELLFISLLTIHCTAYIVPANVPTSIIGNAQFSITVGVYYITANTVVDTTNSLTIDPGVIVYISYQCSLQIRGTLIAEGNATNPITFTALNSSLPWATLQLLSNSASISYCNFLYGGSGAGSNGMLYANSTYYVILL